MGTHNNFLLAFFITTLVSTSAWADNDPIKFGTEMACEGAEDEPPVAGTQSSIVAVLQNADSDATAPSEPGSTGAVSLKSNVTGGFWFSVVPAEAPAVGQILQVFRRTGNDLQLLATLPYGASLTLSSQAPRVDFRSPGMRFEVSITRGAGDTVAYNGYFAIQLPSDTEVLVASQVECVVRQVAAP